MVQAWWDLCSHLFPPPPMNSQDDLSPSQLMCPAPLWRAPLLPAVHGDSGSEYHGCWGQISGNFLAARGQRWRHVCRCGGSPPPGRHDRSRRWSRASFTSQRVFPMMPKRAVHLTLTSSKPHCSYVCASFSGKWRRHHRCYEGSFEGIRLGINSHKCIWWSFFIGKSDVILCSQIAGCTTYYIKFMRSRVVYQKEK